jgi:hypothetical protein
MYKTKLLTAAVLLTPSTVHADPSDPMCAVTQFVQSKYEFADNAKLPKFSALTKQVGQIRHHHSALVIETQGDKKTQSTKSYLDSVIALVDTPDYQLLLNMSPDVKLNYVLQRDKKSGSVKVIEITPKTFSKTHLEEIVKTELSHCMI